MTPESEKPFTGWNMISIIFLIFILLILLNLNSVSNNLKLIFTLDGSAVLHNLGVGIGTLLVGIGSLKVISDWIINTSNRLWFQSIKATYPPEQQNIKFKLFRFPEEYGRIYIYDLTIKTRYWINNMPTLAELGYSHNSWTDVLGKNDTNFREYQNYKEGRVISVISNPYDK